jgi:Protein of unknown function (DUF3237)
VRLEPLYRVEFSYPEHYDVSGPEVRGVYFAEGRCGGTIEGRFRGMNHPRLRAEDDTYLPDFQGVIETEDGARIAFDYRGYGRPREFGREVVGTALHSTGDERYAWLNDAVCVLAAEARDREIRLDVAELIFEPLPE